MGAKSPPDICFLNRCIVWCRGQFQVFDESLIDFKWLYATLPALDDLSRFPHTEF